MMASSSICLSLSAPPKPSPMASPSSSVPWSSDACRVSSCGCSMVMWSSSQLPVRGSRLKAVRKSNSGVVCMAPEEEKLTRRNPLDFPIEWDRPKPGRRADVLPQFSPMKTPLPPPLPHDPPPEEDEEEEEKEEEEEEDPEKKDPEEPEKPE